MNALNIGKIYCDIMKNFQFGNLFNFCLKNVIRNGKWNIFFLFRFFSHHKWKLENKHWLFLRIAFLSVGRSRITKKFQKNLLQLIRAVSITSCASSIFKLEFILNSMRASASLSSASASLSSASFSLSSASASLSSASFSLSSASFSFTWVCSYYYLNTTIKSSWLI